MNGGILHAARPSDSMPKGNFGGMPAEVLAMARQMGLTADDMKQVDSMWKNMDDLAETDPDAYDKFTKDVLAEGPPDKDGNKKARTFRPDPGFVVKLKTISDAGAGLKVKTYDGSGSSKFFVNVASCPALEPPKDANGRPFTDPSERRQAEGLEIPLLVGAVRACADHSGERGSALAVDCVFHPWVLGRCEDDNTFKAQVIDLALGWIEQETRYKVEKRWKTIRAVYKGGLGEDGDQPLPFPIEQAEEQSEPPSDRKHKASQAAEDVGCFSGSASASSMEGPPKGLSTATPESLLRGLSGSVAAPPSEGGRLRMPGDVAHPHAHGAKQPDNGPLIQEVDAAPPPPKLPAKKSKPAVKAGFLRSAPGKEAPRLYDERGSTGDGGKEGSYSRLMSRCQVVDMSTMSPEEQKEAMEKHAGAGTQPAQPPPPTHTPPPAAPFSAPPPSDMSDAFAGLGAGFLGGGGGGLGAARTNDTKSSSSAGTDLFFESLVAAVDPDYADASRPLGDTDTNTALDSLGEVARALSGGSGALGGFASLLDGLAQPNPAAGSGDLPKLMTPLRGLDEGPLPSASSKPCTTRHRTALLEVDAATGKRRATVTVDLANGMDGVDLQVGGAELRLSLPGEPMPLAVVLPFVVSETATKAKYSKAKRALKVTISEA